MEWIKCSERLPLHDTPVLISARMRGPRIVCVAELDTLMDGWSCVGCNGYEWENTFRDEDVTHWMPLPEPPEGE